MLAQLAKTSKYNVIQIFGYNKHMQTEVEAKFLNVNHDELRMKLHELGGTCVTPMRLMKRRNYDFPDGRLEKIGGWVRVRDEGDEITLSYKQLNDRTLHGTKEVELTVNDFAAAEAFVSALGLRCHTSEETKRESWMIDGVHVDLDEWPWIRPFVEIEGADETAVRNLAKQLGLEWSSAVFGSVEIVYQAEYDVSEEEIVHGEFYFGDPPAWLAAKRRTK